MTPFVHRFRVRYHECDAQGVVFNAHHVAYVDVALTELWRAVFGGYGSMVDLGFDVMVADVHAAFRSPARFDDEVDLALTIERFGRTSMTTSWTASVGGRLCVEGEIVHVWVDATSHEPVVVPEEARARLAVHTAE